MKGFTFIIGGARSGKSSYAVQLAKEISAKAAKGTSSSLDKGKVAFIATAASSDDEMKDRIRLHKMARPPQWKVIEEGRDIGPILPELEEEYKVVLIDCLGLLISNLLAADLTDNEIELNIKDLIKTIQKVNLYTIIVSNEVGSGIVPENPMARRFRDLLGFTNQMLAKRADEVIFLQSGIPIVIKKKSKK